MKYMSGQFIYAATLLKFVGASSNFNNLDEQLKIISSPGPLQGSPFSDLNQLYTRILSRYPRRDNLLSVLGALLVWHDAVCVDIIERLRVQFSEFWADDYLVPGHPESLLRYLEYVESLILDLRDLYYKRHPMEDSLADAILADVRAVQDTAL